MLNICKGTLQSSPSTPTRMKNSRCFARGTSCAFKRISNVMLQLFWLFLHLVASVWHFVLDITHTLQSYAISSGLLKKYNALDLSKLQYLAIVIESQEAYDTASVVKLLRWLSSIGVKHVCLYDMDGVLKKCKKVILDELGDSRLWHLAGDEKETCLDQLQTTLEFVSLPDGKEGVTKAANFLYSKYLELPRSLEQEKPLFTEANMTKALTAVGCGGAEPNLLLVYGPVRCHLGFPAWRMRYTEIVHMGSLKSMKHGALVKAIHKFVKVQQNYGT